MLMGLLHNSCSGTVALGRLLRNGCSGTVAPGRGTVALEQSLWDASSWTIALR